MKCQNCKAEIDKVVCHHFHYDGSDSSITVEIGNNNASDELCQYITVPMSITAMEHWENDGAEDFVDSIYCPKCNKFPFGTVGIAIHQFADVVFHPSDKNEFC